MQHKSFDEIISTLNLPRHCTPYRLIPSTFQIPEHILPTFKKLFRPANMLKNTGNGEVAIYWLFNKKYGGLYDVVKQSKTGNADLLIDNTPVEIKAWDVRLDSGGLIKIGRFEKQHNIRRIINIIFGCYNVFMAGRNSEKEKHGKNSYLSESSFGINGLTRAFDCALKIRNINLSQLDNIRDVLSLEAFDGLEDPKDFAAKTFAMLATEKLIRKIGSRNFIINTNPVKIGEVKIIQLGNLENIDLDIVRNGGVRVRCSELFVDLRAFKDKEDVS